MKWLLQQILRLALGIVGCAVGAGLWWIIRTEWFGYFCAFTLVTVVVWLVGCLLEYAFKFFWQLPG